MHKTGETIAVQFAISDPATAGLVDADALPTGVLIINGVDDDTTVTVTNLSTGVYRGSVTFPAIADGDVLQLRITATVGGVTGGGIVWSSVGVTKRPADLPVAAAIADAVWDEATAGHTTAGTFGKLLADLVAAGGATAAAVWAYATRTLTQTAAAVAAALTGSTITIYRGDTLTVSLTGLGSLAGRTKLWITGKQDRGHPDASAVCQIEETAGLAIINGAAAATAANGSLTVTDEAAGNIDIVLKGVETAKLAQLTAGAYDVQMLTAAGPRTLTDAKLVVSLDVTRATS